MDETISLIKTVDIILSSAKGEIKEIIIVVSKHTSKDSLVVIETLKTRLGDLLVVYCQELPFIGGALRGAFSLAQGSHTIMMASDLETNPSDVIKLIDAAKENPNDIIAASRWLKGGNFTGYSKVKLVANWLFQHIFSTIYQSHLTDLTFAYRLYPTKVLQSINWTEFKHPFFFETLLKPLRLGIKVIEIPTTWTARIEGKSRNTFLENFAYLKTGLVIRLLPVNAILKKAS